MNRKQQQTYMLRAIELAKKGFFHTRPNPNVGCVLVSQDCHIIANGWHKFYGGDHAEIEAINQAQMLGKKTQGSVAYVTLEPCSHYGKTAPCADALILAGIVKVFIASEDPNPLVAGQGIKKLRQAGIEVSVGLCQKEAKALNFGFFKRYQQKIPYVRIKIAASIDGRIAMASGQSKWITNEVSRSDVQILRSQAGAIVTGIGTVLADNPSLNARPEGDLEYQFSQPLRVIVDKHLGLVLNSKIIDKDGLCVVMTQSQDKIKIEALEFLNVTVVKIPVDFDARKILEYILQYLAKNNVNDVLVEAGPKLVSSFIQAKIFDELIVYTASSLMGASAIPMTNIKLEKMTDKIKFKLHSVKQLSDDIKCTYMLEK